MVDRAPEGCYPEVTVSVQDKVPATVAASGGEENVTDEASGDSVA
jgi:hypothetical protein